MTSPAARRRAAALAGHQGDVGAALAATTHEDASVRAAAYTALARCGALDADHLARALGDHHPTVRRRAAELAAAHPGAPVAALLSDPEPLVAEMAAWALGEHEIVDDPALDALVRTATGHPEALVREAAVAALGAIGDERGLPAVLAATTDKPAVRRRAVIALVAFDGPEVDAAVRASLDDRDWQVREAAEELLRD